MLHETLTIAPKTANETDFSQRRRRRPEKGRTFAASLLAVLCADDLWPGGQTAGDTLRPVYARLAGSAQELPSFVANLRRGHKITLSDGIGRQSRGNAVDMEFLRSAGYTYSAEQVVLEEQRYQLMNVCLPDLLCFDPGMVSDAEQGVRFVLATPHWWTAEQRPLLERDEPACARLLRHAEVLGLAGAAWGGPRGRKEILELAALGARFAGCLDRHTDKPLPLEVAFHLHLYLHALRAGIAALPQTVHGVRDERWAWARTAPAMEWNFDAAGLHPPVIMDVSTDALDAFLAAQVQTYYRLAESRSQAA
jgi:hypothetical protein